MQEDQQKQETSQEITSVDRLMEIYQQVAESEDIAYKTASLLTMSNYYAYALKISNSINGRQGKNRLTINQDTYKLMSYSNETDVDDILDQRLTQLFINILNGYLQDKQVLPTKNANGVISRVKTLFIMLVTTNQYSLIPMLNIPPYMLKYCTDLFDKIREIQDKVLVDFIAYLEEHDNKIMADRVRKLGNEFWGTEGIKANVIYDRHFGDIADKIKEPILMYEAYLRFRAEYRKNAVNILPSRLYQIFDITPGQYDRARENVYAEIKQLYPEEDVVKKLIYEQ